MSEELGFEVRLTLSRDEAIERVTDALKVEGFGVITRIDIDKTFREKIGEHFRPYTILGACNPQLAHIALTAISEMGLLLPCNVTVEADINGSMVRIINPALMMQARVLGDEEVVRYVAEDATGRLKRVAEALRAEEAMRAA
jgi:uncharacterized protein (DUF302 family)